MSGYQHEPTTFSAGVARPIISVTVTFNTWVACSSDDRRQAPLGPDTPLFGSRIPPGTSTQSPNTSISPSTLFDIFDGARRLLEARHGRPDASRTIGPLDAARPNARIAPSHTDVAGLSRLGIEPRGMPSTTATGPKWPYVALNLRVRHDVTLPVMSWYGV
ncbi:hypothetical protein IEO21_05847 [Rhodonia placenta]|uniref:Uncharacterized protein n=1 Tax=Rhodonia placenta TaxID=104341 RepID=A0A8H7U1V2_9APHY|nr:hypothetical protein IEO21_05847 [Postia placenta]